MSKEDSRQQIKIFLGSSEELREERQSFAQALSKINDRPDLRRQYVLTPVRWETDAFGFSEDINETIQSTVEFDRLHVVVILIWNRLGKGTLGEYEKALRLERLRGRPRLLIYVRDPAPDADPAQIEEIRAFKERVIADGGVPTTYSSLQELWDRLQAQLPTLIVNTEAVEPSTPARLRSLFAVTAATTFLVSILALSIVSFMSFPGSNTTYINVLLLLVTPPIIFLGFLLSSWAYHRLLNSLKTLWRSPRFDDHELYETFRSAIPRFAMPDQLKKEFPRLPGSQPLQVLLLALALIIPGVAQYQILFEEILLWQYVVGTDTIDPGAGEEEPGGHCVKGYAAPGCVKSRFVDCAHREWMTFGWRDESVRQLAKSLGRPVVFVHAHCRFARDADLPTDELFVRNRGPEIFLPWQPRIYFGLIILTGLGVIGTAYRLVRFPRELSPPT